MSADHEERLEFLATERSEEVNFPVILKTQHSISISKNHFLRRNTPLNRSQYKGDARVVCKSGRLLVYFKKIPQKSLQYAKDPWNTLINMQWRWLLLTVAVVNVVAYISCALLFYFDSWVSGDFDNEEGHASCMVGINNMRHFFMLGIETITTIGYGYVRPSENCDLYFVVLAFSTITTIFIDGAFISVVYAKLNKPKERNVHGHMFTKKAVICLRNGKLCLIVRVNDKEGRHGINTNVCLYVIRDSVMLEGELIPNYTVEMEVKPFGMLFWPVDIIHEIGPKSPLWDISAKNLMTTRLELVVVVSGSSMKTGQSTRSQISYLNREIMWGYQFSPCLEYNNSKKEYVINKKLFQQTVPQEVPLCSAKVLRELQQQIKCDRQSLNLHRNVALIHGLI